MNNAGRFMILPKGEYNDTTQYYPLDSVTYGGDAYIAIKETTGNLPTDTNFWIIFVKGAISTPQYTVADEVAELTSGEDINTAFSKIAKAVKDYIAHIVNKATNTVLGHVKVTDSSAVTDSTGLALAATEKNASIEGTLANQIDVLNSNLRNKIVRRIAYGQGSGFYTASIPIQAGTDNAGMYLLTMFSRYEGKSDIFLLNILSTNGYVLHPMVKNSNNMTAEYDGTNLNLNRGTGDEWIYSLVQLCPYASNVRKIVDWT